MRNLKRIILMYLMIMCLTVGNVIQTAAEEDEKSGGPGGLYALSAVLMDADSGRVLFEKDGYVKRDT